MARWINIFDWQAWACPRREWEFADRYQIENEENLSQVNLKASHWVVFEPCHSILLADKYGFPVHWWFSLYITSNKSTRVLRSLAAPPKHPRPANRHGPSWLNLMVFHGFLRKIIIFGWWNPILSHSFVGLSSSAPSHLSAFPGMWKPENAETAPA